jgi:hypothetical protein
VIRRYLVAFFAVAALVAAACSSDSGNKTNAAGSGASGSGSTQPFLIVEMTSTDATGSAEFGLFPRARLRCLCASRPMIYSLTLETAVMAIGALLVIAIFDGATGA